MNKREGGIVKAIINGCTRGLDWRVHRFIILPCIAIVLIKKGKNGMVFHLVSWHNNATNGGYVFALVRLESCFHQSWIFTQITRMYTFSYTLFGWCVSCVIITTHINEGLSKEKRNNQNQGLFIMNYLFNCDLYLKFILWLTAVNQLAFV